MVKVILHVIKIEPNKIMGGVDVTTEEGYNWNQVCDIELGEYRTTQKFIDFLERK